MITKADNSLEVPVESLKVWGTGAIRNFLWDTVTLSYRDVNIIGGAFDFEVLNEEDDYDFEDGGSLVNIYSNKKLIACFCTKKDAVLVFTKIDDNLVTINEK